ncbi:hypothetical protein FPZ12_041290 [Amycolatopsis acidicola]|uniref:Uncharacterized protein n=1 Tax=Amycolatopsis acidicola TaxID=2596893 RepID=A0A5N0UM02_9PSEU|nr:hypothetical protein [Amycolatopsis acidicola]KAA9150349.1 hypothetical protein FPZ12_041290 [Amycolatopsis acidicola]
MVVLRWVLLCALGFAVLGMHSLSTVEAPMPPAAHAVMAMSGGDHEPVVGHPGSPGHSHDLLHLCLAVLAGLAGLVLAWLWFRAAPSFSADPRACPVRAGRGPPKVPPATGRLSLLCVLRL